MRSNRRHFVLPLFLLFALFLFTVPSWAASDQYGILVGRIAHVDGQLLRYVEEEKDWVQTVQDAPFGLEDALYSGDDARAEFILPNGTWMRIGENTQVQLIDLNPEATTVDVASGLARLYNKSGNAVAKLTTPFGYVVAPSGSAVDLYVGDESLEVIAVRGEVDFVHDGTGTRYPIREGGDSLIADKRATAPGRGTVDGDWDDWNGQRENLWADRQRSRSASADLLPEPIRDESYVLDDNGRWERVYYEGAYRDMWRPTVVEPSWRPFTAGRWISYYGDNCWIPDEPFGYVTHHYGSWVYVDSFSSWYWMPPVVRRYPQTPSLVLLFGWYPGRVGWFHSRDHIGWVPLAPHEHYYGHRPWGHHTKLIHRSRRPKIDIHRYRYLDEAVVVHRDHFHQGKRYGEHARRDVRKSDIVKQYKPVAAISPAKGDKQRFSVIDREVARKPHNTVARRIDANQKRIKESGRFDRARIEKELQRARIGTKPSLAAPAVAAPMLTPKLVEADKVRAPLDKTALPRKEIKAKERERRLAPETNRPGFVPRERERGERPRLPGENGEQREQKTIIPPVRDESNRDLRDQGPPDRDRDRLPRGENQTLRSPRETEQQERVNRQPKVPERQQHPKELQPRPEQDASERRQQFQRDWQLQQPQERQGQRQKEPQETLRQRQEEQQGKQQDILRQRQPEEVRSRPEQGAPERRQKEPQETLRQRQQEERQQQELQRRQREEEFNNQRQLQRQQQLEDQRRREQEAQRQRQLEIKQRQEQAEREQRQQALQRRQQQELQQRQEMENRQRQQELQQRQQREQQRQEALRRQQQEEQQKVRQEQQTAPKKKNPSPEELLKLQQQRGWPQ